MNRLDRRLTLLEQRIPDQAPPERRATRAALRRLSLAELEALEGAIVAREAGLPLDGPQRAAIAAWERASEEGATSWAD